MADKVPLPIEELRRQLDDQLLFLKSSAKAFDEGFEAEAKRLAVVLRVLMHDTRNSKSLLGQLGKKGGKFLGTAIPFDPANMLSHGGLVSIALGPPISRYVAELDNCPVHQWVDFEDWWNQPVFSDDQKRVMSRADLVGVVANQDGGAHVDPSLDATYHALSRNNAMGWMASDGTEFSPMEDPARAAIRQIAHEVLRTLDPDYRKKPSHQARAVFAGVRITVGPKSEEPVKQPLRSSKVGRNAPCPCGGGQKYKHCHGRHI